MAPDATPHPRMAMSFILVSSSNDDKVQDDATRPQPLSPLPSVGYRHPRRQVLVAQTGSKECDYPRCKRASSRGSNRCVSHGGGKACTVSGCHVAAHSHDLCKKHGGGPRCVVQGCSKSSQAGGKCIAHGGGQLCTEPGCHMRAQRGKRCSAHGGFVLCAAPGCFNKDRGGGLCNQHRRHLLCSVPTCKRLGKVDGVCTQHYKVAKQATDHSNTNGVVLQPPGVEAIVL
ncbi:hypothetical protein SDRG_05604 [Saprolegnia diclina VS20]|uniref:WRKY19-like zinc finger domain-containing protein n=1 Tax=Saprolegnia diclina (strain VS20) TaxID=1156394 RepID=T0QFP5_SAPDV|nr:hypothetical protein SDRG_05604 [Saprolegnia diclina VS20]EQC36769.1 hypothetical protein SDRG_05604 [Saprolegnia diclina VS20]|eukprot:XP_008609550.1 hypothetical protein SDRG_05604 [Saprolegnia diclina VS20]